jgi:formate dehydrogenase assembly factor FdhD
MNKRVTHRDFVLQLAVALMQNFAENERYKECQISVKTSNKANLSRHRYIKLAKRSYCKSCDQAKIKSFIRSKKRKALSEIDTNQLAKRLRDATIS